MPSSGRLLGSILLVAGLAIGAIAGLWLFLGIQEGNLQGSGAVFGLLFVFLVLVAPLVGAGIFFLSRGRAEDVAYARVRGQRRLLDMLATRGQLSIPDVALELGMTRDQIESDLYDLVGKGLFTGYVDWRRGELHSVEAAQIAAQLESTRTCPNCGSSDLRLAGKGLVECAYCGAKTYLNPADAEKLDLTPVTAIPAEGGSR
jgi:ribosomal protein L37AE/L43A